MGEDNLMKRTASPPIHAPKDACQLRVRFEPKEGKYLFEGIIDAQARAVLDDLAGAIEPPKVIFDFGGVKRINSMGVALLLRCFKQIRDEKGIHIQLANLNSVNTMLFKITGVFLLAGTDAGTDTRNPQ